MKNFYFFSLLFFTLVGCSSDDVSPEIIDSDPSYFEIFVNNGTHGNVVSLATNEQCGYLRANVKNSHHESTTFTMSFELTTEGHIKEIIFAEHSDNHRHYTTADFNKTEAFQISNFDFDPVERTLYFEFEGYLYEENRTNSVKYVKGKFYDSKTRFSECNHFPKKVTLTGAPVPIHFTNSHFSSNGALYQYMFYSENGYLLRIATNNAIQNFEQGTYNFSSESDLQIIFEQYTGPLRSGSYYNSNEWLIYDCEGSITITGHHETPFSHITGNFTFTAQGPGEEPPMQLQGVFEM